MKTGKWLLVSPNADSLITWFYGFITQPMHNFKPSFETINLCVELSTISEYTSLRQYALHIQKAILNRIASHSIPYFNIVPVQQCADLVIKITTTHTKVCSKRRRVVLVKWNTTDACNATHTKASTLINRKHGSCGSLKGIEHNKERYESTTPESILTARGFLKECAYILLSKSILSQAS